MERGSPNKENKGEESKLIHRFEDSTGTIEIWQKVIGNSTNDIVRLKSKSGDWKELNHLLPEGSHIYFDYTGTRGGYSRYEPSTKEVIINYYELESEGWQYLVTILHEIGHAVHASENTEEVEEMLSIKKKLKSKENAVLFARLEFLGSRGERAAWTFALKQLRAILDTTQLPEKHFFSSKTGLREFIQNKLRTYKESAMWRASQMPENVRETLLENLSRLYFKEKRF